MGKAVDAYRRMEKAIDDYLDTITDVVSDALPDDRDADITYIEETYGVDSNDIYQQQDSEWLRIAEEADNGKMAKKLREEYGDE